MTNHNLNKNKFTNKQIPISIPHIGESEISFVNDAMKSGWVSSLGPYIELFEKEFAAFCNTKYALTVSNGTTALHLALSAYGIERGDEVIVPDLTFVATANAVSYTGATPVFVDVDSDTYCIATESIEKAISTKTKAIIPVHLYGHPCEMDLINGLAKKYNLIVIEDAAEAHGARYKDRVVGGLGSCGVFSFYGNKIITTGEGGMLVTNNERVYERAKLLRDHAMSKDKKYWHTTVGYNYRMTNIQAALGLAQLRQIDYFISERNIILNTYKKYLKKSEALKINFSATWAKSVCWLVCVEILSLDVAKRDDLIKQLKNLGIDSRPFFYPLSDLPMFQPSNTPIAHSVSAKSINLPTYIGLKESDIEYICANLIEIVNRM